MCRLVDNKDNIDCKKMCFFIKEKKVSPDSVNFSIISALKLMKKNSIGFNTPDKDTGNNDPW